MSSSRRAHAGEPILLDELLDGASLDSPPRFSLATLERAVEVMIRDGLLTVHQPRRTATWECAQLAPVGAPGAGRLSPYACLFMTEKFAKRHKRNRTRPGKPPRVPSGVIEYAVWQLRRRLVARFTGAPGRWFSPPADARIPLTEVLLGLTDDPRSRLSVIEYAAAVRWMIDRGLLMWDGKLVPPAAGTSVAAADPQVQHVLLAGRSVEEPEVVRDTVRLTGLLWHLVMCDAEQNLTPSSGQQSHAADGLVSRYEIRRATRWLAAHLTARRVEPTDRTIRVSLADLLSAVPSGVRKVAVLRVIAEMVGRKVVSVQPCAAPSSGVDLCHFLAFRPERTLNGHSFAELTYEQIGKVIWELEDSSNTTCEGGVWFERYTATANDIERWELPLHMARPKDAAELGQAACGCAAAALQSQVHPLPSALGRAAPPNGAAPTADCDDTSVEVDELEQKLAGLPKRAKVAYLQYRTGSQGLTDPTDEAAYEAYKQLQDDDKITRALPKFKAWVRYLREARRLLGEQKHKRRTPPASGLRSAISVGAVS